MSPSSILQRIANKYMVLAQTDLELLAGDMALALALDEAPMPRIKHVEKIVFCAEPGSTPHISVYFDGVDGAEYCWDMTVQIIKKREFDSSSITEVPHCYGALTVMRMPNEQSSVRINPGKEGQWTLQNQ